MKRISLCISIATILFTSCTPVSIPATVTVTPIIELPTVKPISAEGFSEPDPKTWVSIMPAVREYFYYREKAIIANNIEELWGHYPELKNSIDITQGINQEQVLLSSYQLLKPLDGNFFPEQYERLRVRISNDEAEVYVHGIELLLFVDKDDNFQESGGEIKIILYMHKQNNLWVVYKTDRIQMGEKNPFSP